jgi:Homeodomain-like domain
MFKRFLRSLRQTESKRESKQSKRECKRNQVQSTQQKPKGNPGFSQTTPAERKRMLELRRTGHSVHAIARLLGRSSRTVHQVLTERGTQPLPDPEGLIDDTPWSEDKEDGRRVLRRSKASANGGQTTGEFSASIWKRLEPMLEQRAADVLKSNDHLVVQILAAHLGVDVPRKSLTDLVHEEIRGDPDLRRQLAEQYLEDKQRRGRSDTEIAAEVLELAVKIAEIMARGRWPDVIEKAVTSGELRKTIQAVVGNQPSAVDPPSGPILLEQQNQSDPATSSASVAQPSNQCPQPQETVHRIEGSEMVGQNPTETPMQDLSPSSLDLEMLQCFIRGLRREFVKKVDWQDLEARLRGDPGEMVTDLWYSARTGNQGHGMTLVSLCDISEFLESVNDSVTTLHKTADRKKDYEVAIRVRNYLTETDEGRRWLEGAQHAAIIAINSWPTDKDEVGDSNPRPAA